jgi:RNA polymerase sigma-70 factor, ECF subfamily
MDRGQILLLVRERIVAFAASRISRDVAEDLAQEVLVVIEEKYADVTALEDLVPLSLQVLCFKMAAHVRKSIRRGEMSAISTGEAFLADPSPGPEVSASRQELLELLRKAIPKLGERCREIFRLKLLGRTFPEIQEELGASSINTVYTWDARCRQRLLELIGGRWEKR